VHRLLRRQLRKLFGERPPAEALAPLLAAVDEAYRQADLDRTMVERSLELSSQELLEANRELRRRGDDLERRVARRTEQLSDANRELERQVAERSRAEERAALAEARLRDLIEALPAVTYVAEYGVEGRWQYVSPQVEEVLGIRPEELLARPGSWYERVLPEDRGLVLEEEKRALSARAAFALEYRMLHRSGRIVWVRDQALPSQQGEGIAYQGVILDVSERKKLQEELLQAQKVEAVGRLAGGVAHDFNNMLTAIAGYAELLRREVPEPSAAAHQVDEILRAADRATALTSKLLAFGRRQMLEPREFDLSGLVAGLVPMIRRLIGEDVVLEMDLDPEPAPVRADPLQMEQALVNLVINSRDAMPGGGILRVRTRNRPERPSAAGALPPGDVPLVEGPHVALAVEDTGTGIDPRHMPLLFEPFFTTKPVGKGTGLGLSSAYGIVRQSGGEIRAESRLGEGSRFEILLPRALGAARTASDSVANGERPPGGRERILLVEDEPAVRKLATLMLEELGYRVTAASDGAEALELLELAGEFRVDLLVTDVVMPRVGGVELSTRLRVERPALPVLFVSGYAESSPLPPGGIELERRDGFLQKPFTQATLATRVREVLDRRA